MNEDNFGKGALDRPEDYNGPRAWRHEEVAGAVSGPQWIEKDPFTGFVTYPKRDQSVQSSCVSYVLSKQLAVDELSENGIYRELSPRSIYAYTAVPGGGSSSIVATKMAVKLGMTLEHLLITDGLSEEEATKDKGYVTDAKQIAFVYRPGSYVEAATDFDTIAGIIETHRKQGIKKVVAATIIGVNNGTWHSMYPKPPKPGDPGVWFHRIAFTDFGLIGGKPHLAFDNSWGSAIGNKGQQFIGLDYAPAIYGAIYTLNQSDKFSDGAPAPKVKYHWNNDLTFGSRGADVTALQEALQALGMFPVSSVLKPTGNYLGLTQKCVEIFQQAFMIPVTGKIGPEDRARLNEIFK